MLILHVLWRFHFMIAKRDELSSYVVAALLDYYTAQGLNATIHRTSAGGPIYMGK